MDFQSWVVAWIWFLEVEVLQGFTYYPSSLATVEMHGLSISYAQTHENTIQLDNVKLGSVDSKAVQSYTEKSTTPCTAPAA